MTPKTQLEIPATDSKPELVVLSLGWGVQSFTIAAMVALGELPPIDAAIHADTTHESQGTYEHARRWTPWLRDRQVNVITVQGNRTQIIQKEWGKGSVMIPAFTAAREDGSHGQLKRQCTRIWKIDPIRRHIRKMLPAKRRLRPGIVECWQGISLDEFTRMRSSDVKYIQNTYPLVDARMTRNDCVQWLRAHHLEVPPKSACTFCPFHSRSQWAAVKREQGPDWQEALETDNTIRNMRENHILFVHPARSPLDQAITVPGDTDRSHQLELEIEIPCDGGACFV